jgi:hypothetical protein
MEQIGSEKELVPTVARAGNFVEKCFRKVLVWVRQVGALERLVGWTAGRRHRLRRGHAMDHEHVTSR